MTFLSIPKAAKKAGCCTRTFRAMVFEGAIPAVRLGRRLKIDEQVLYEWLRSPRNFGQREKAGNK